MGRGYSLHIGLNKLDPSHYGGWEGELNACEFDANDMEDIGLNQGFQTAKLLTGDANRTNVISEILNAANELESGDIFWISYSGHGGQVPDTNSDEVDSIDETWCLFDGQLIDDELYNFWAKFKEGVRILILSDSCHSGTIFKALNTSPIRNSEGYPARYLPASIGSATYVRNKDFYQKVLNQNKQIEPIKASVKLISGCQDNQYSYDGTFNGQFTGRLKHVWNGGKFRGNYKMFHGRIMSLLPENQTPNYTNIGKVDESFNSEKPFKI